MKNYTYIIFQRILEGCTFSGPRASHFCFLFFFSSFFFLHINKQTHTGSTANAAGLVSFRFVSFRDAFDRFRQPDHFSRDVDKLLVRARNFLEVLSIFTLYKSLSFFLFFFNKLWNEFLKEEGSLNWRRKKFTSFKSLVLLFFFYKIILTIIEIIESLLRSRR